MLMRVYSCMHRDDVMVMSFVTFAFSLIEGIIQFTALTWMKTFLGLAQRSMMGFTANFLLSILPCVAYDSNKTGILTMLKVIHF